MSLFTFLADENLSSVNYASYYNSRDYLNKTWNGHECEKEISDMNISFSDMSDIKPVMNNIEVNTEIVRKQLSTL